MMWADSALRHGSLRVQQQSRRWLSSLPPPRKSSSSSSMLWQLATLAAVGTTFVVVGNYLGDASWRYDKDPGDKPVPPQAQVTTKCYLDIAIDDHPMGRIVIGLHGNVVPKTAQNFETLCRGGEKMGNIDMTYRGNVFHRIIPGFMLQSGEKPGRSIYGVLHYDGRFPDENFQLKHLGPGIVSMANAGKDTNGSQFFITTAKTPHLDGGHVVFGTVLDGWDVVRDIEACGTKSGRPIRKATIVDCGVLQE